MKKFFLFLSFLGVFFISISLRATVHAQDCLCNVGSSCLPFDYCELDTVEHCINIPCGSPTDCECKEYDDSIDYFFCNWSDYMCNIYTIGFECDGIMYSAAMQWCLEYTNEQSVCSPGNLPSIHECGSLASVTVYPTPIPDSDGCFEPYYPNPYPPPDLTCGTAGYLCTGYDLCCDDSINCPPVPTINPTLPTCITNEQCEDDWTSADGSIPYIFDVWSNCSHDNTTGENVCYLWSAADCTGAITNIDGNCYFLQCPIGTYFDGINPPFEDIGCPVLFACCTQPGDDWIERHKLDPICTTDGGETGIKTAVGCVSTTSTTGFLSFILPWAIGVGGGTAFILIIVAGFLIMASGGDPKRAKAGKELMGSAVAGLLMIIFSVYMLDLIGIRIFRLPGL